MLKEFSTDPISASRQLLAWREIMSDVYYSVDVVRPERTLRGRLREVDLDDISLSRFDSDHQRVLRTRSRIAQDPEDSYVFIMPQRQKMYYNQLGRSGFVSESDYILVSTSEFYELSCPDDFVNYTIKLPGEKLRARIPNVEDHLCCRFPMNREMAQVAMTLARKAAAAMVDAPADQMPLVARKVFDFVSMVVECEDSSLVAMEKRARFMLRRRISHDIRTRLADPDMSPRDIAERAGISVSYLHRIFNEHGTTVTTYVSEQRLSAAYEKLASPGPLRMTVAEVAYAVGFKSPPQFTRAFSRRFGRTPSDVRPG